MSVHGDRPDMSICVYWYVKQQQTKETLCFLLSKGSQYCWNLLHYVNTLVLFKPTKTQRLVDLGNRNFHRFVLR